MSQKGAYPIIKDSFKIAVMKVMLWSETCLTGKIATLVFGASKCRNCSTMKTEKECQCSQEVEVVHNFVLQGIFVLSQAIICLELQKQSHGGVLWKRCS